MLQVCVLFCGPVIELELELSLDLLLPSGSVVFLAVSDG